MSNQVYNYATEESLQIFGGLKNAIEIRIKNVIDLKNYPSNFKI